MNVFPTRSALLLSALSLCLVPLSSSAVTPDETDAAKIMSAVDGRDDGDKQIARMVMIVRDDAGRERKRVVQSRRMDFPGQTKSITLFESPADVRNTGLLSFDYDDGKKSDDQWLYMPALKKPTRIASSDKSGSFMGTDMSYADMTKQDPKNFDYTISQPSATVDGDDCWVIEAKPNNPATAEETGYVKSLIWVSKTKLMPLKIKNWIREGQKIKYIKFADVQQINGIWVAKKILAQTKRGKTVESKTVIAFKSIKFNQASVTESDFTHQKLKSGL